MNCFKLNLRDNNTWQPDWCVGTCISQFEYESYKNMIVDKKQPSLKFFKNHSLDQTSKIFVHSDVNKESEMYLKVLSNLETLNLESSGIEFWIIKDSPNLDGAIGVVPFTKPNVIIISLASLEDDENFFKNLNLNLFNNNYIKFILYHESFHVRQNEMTGCLTLDQATSLSYNGMVTLREGSADYYALRRFPNELEREEILFSVYNKLTYKNLNNINEMILDQGLLASGSHYESRIFWEYSPINMYTFFQKYGEEEVRTNFNFISKERVIELLKDSELPNYVSSLGASSLGDGLVNLSQMYNNFNRLNYTLPHYGATYPITNFLYKKELANSNLKPLDYYNPYQNKDSEGNDIKNLILGARKGKPKEFTLKIPPLGTRSVKLSEFGPNYEGAFVSQMNAMIKISYPSDNITSKIVSMVEASNGALGSLRDFKKSIWSKKGEAVIVGSRGNRYPGEIIEINKKLDGEFNAKGLANSPFWWDDTDMWNYIWNDGVPVRENILMDFANTSNQAIELTVKIEPLCSRQRVPNYQDMPYQQLSFMCDANCLLNKTINICWEGKLDGPKEYSFQDHSLDHCMFGNTNPLNISEYGNTERYHDRNYTYDKGFYTTYYICGEDSEESELSRISNVKYYKKASGDE